MLTRVQTQKDRHSTEPPFTWGGKFAPREKGMGKSSYQAILNKCHTCFYKMKKTREFDNDLQKCYNLFVSSDVVYKRITGKANDARGQEANLETFWPKGNVPAEVIYR